MSEKTDVLVVNNLTKVYGWEVNLGRRKIGRRVEAVKETSFKVRKGEIFGFLGPNGAGKTTAIRSILGYLTIQSGSITINEMDYRKDALLIRENIGYVPEDVSLYGNFTGNELIEYFGKFRPVDQTFIKILKKIFKVDLTMKIRSLSSGNRQQAAIIASIASNPDFLILDESSKGLDPLMTSKYHDLLLKMRDEGKTIFLSSHDLSEVQAICDRVGIIRQGRIVVVESVKNLRSKSMQMMKVEFADGTDDIIDELEKIPNIVSVKKKDGIFEIRVSEDINDLLKVITSRKVKRMTLEESSLEEIFLAYYKDELEQEQEEEES
ncbi:MAG: ATP-binding cassette domain-containing protein [Candidatus Hodarchaeales archaeon]